MMGDGVIDLKGIRAMIEAAGYHGPQEVEIFSARQLVEAPGRRGARDLRRALPQRVLTNDRLVLRHARHGCLGSTPVHK